MITLFFLQDFTKQTSNKQKLNNRKQSKKKQDLTEQNKQTETANMKQSKKQDVTELNKQKWQHQKRNILKTKPQKTTQTNHKTKTTKQFSRESLLKALG